MMINGEEWKVAELPSSMKKWVRDKFEEMKSSYHVEMMKRRCIEIPRETTERKDGKHGYIGK